ncbi:unnamed protein product, partial [Dovyalis caffra]
EPSIRESEDASRIEGEDEEQGVATQESGSFAFMDDFNRDRTLSTKQASIHESLNATRYV